MKTFLFVCEWARVQSNHLSLDLEKQTEIEKWKNVSDSSFSRKEFSVDCPPGNDGYKAARQFSIQRVPVEVTRPGNMWMQCITHSPQSSPSTLLNPCQHQNTASSLLIKWSTTFITRLKFWKNTKMGHNLMLISSRYYLYPFPLFKAAVLM